MSSDVCKHCTESACLDVCPTGALMRTEFGTVIVQDDICNGCGYCIPACPFGVVARRESDGGAHKCTLCYDRLGEGLTPACAKACPTESIQFGPLDELRERAQQRVSDLQDAGTAGARLYLDDPADGIGGAGAFFLLLDEPEVYGLPPDPVVTTPGPAANVAARGRCRRRAGRRGAGRVPGQRPGEPVMTGPADASRTGPPDASRTGPGAGSRAGPGAGAGRAAPRSRWRGKGQRGERPVVPRAEFRSYYGLPILKEPVWRSPDVPGYLFLGGLAGASSVLAAFAHRSGNQELARVAKTGAAGAIGLSGIALVHDLGRPSRFLNMLRVFKVSSPMSVGSWLIAVYGPAAVAAAATALTGRLPRAGAAATVGAAALGSGVATYTAALLSDTAVAGLA